MITKDTTQCARAALVILCIARVPELTIYSGTKLSVRTPLRAAESRGLAIIAIPKILAVYLITQRAAHTTSNGLITLPACVSSNDFFNSSNLNCVNNWSNGNLPARHCAIISGIITLGTESP